MIPSPLLFSKPHIQCPDALEIKKYTISPWVMFFYLDTDSKLFFFSNVTLSLFCRSLPRLQLPLLATPMDKKPSPRKRKRGVPVGLKRKKIVSCCIYPVICKRGREQAFFINIDDVSELILSVMFWT